MKYLNKKIKFIWWRVKSIVAIMYYGNPSKTIKIVGVTGTNGKTTTATLLYHIATGLGYKAGLIGTAGNIIVKEKREATHTTPDSISLTKLFAEMRDKGCEYVFMEVSSHALDQNRVWGVNFAGGIFTNLTHDHLDYHKTMEAYFRAKKKFFKMLPANAFALANGDDQYGKRMLEDIDAKKFLYGFNEEFDFKGEILKLSFSGLELMFNDQKVNTNLLGKFNAYNVLSVWSASKILGFDMEKVNKVLEHIEPPKGRFDHFVSKTGVLAIVDYAHTPDALEKIFMGVKSVKPAGGRIISLFGCGGDRDPMKRKKMGKIGAVFSDIAIFTSDNPRGENPDAIIETMKEDLTKEDLLKVRTISNRREAIQEAVKIAKENDIILAAGKGHENYQEIKGVKHHFDDMEELQKAFSEI